jgi:hypothetical protein
MIPTLLCKSRGECLDTSIRLQVQLRVQLQRQLQRVKARGAHHEAEVDTPEAKQGLELALRVEIGVVGRLAHEVQHKSSRHTITVLTPGAPTAVHGRQLLGHQQLVGLEGVAETWTYWREWS